MTSTAVVVGVVVLVGLALLALVSAGGSSARTDGAVKPRQAVSSPKPTTIHHSPPSPRPVVRSMPPAQVREVLVRRLGEEWEREQAAVREEVIAQERQIAVQLQRALAIHTFDSLRNLHRASYLTADHAWTLMNTAREANRSLRLAIKDTHRAIDADRLRGGRSISSMRRTLDHLHNDRAVIEQHLALYREDVDRLNQQTALLRDRIRDECGAPGRTWYEALMRRTRERRGAD